MTASNGRLPLGPDDRRSVPRRARRSTRCCTSTVGDQVRRTSARLALMPIFTAGLAAIPPEYASSGSTANNIAQRIAGSLGVAGLTIVVTSQQ